MSPFELVLPTHHRCNMFVRYLVGQCAREPDDPSWFVRERKQECTTFALIIEQALERSLVLGCRVTAFHSGSFHRALYTGMWRYQSRRLALVSRDAFRRASKTGLVAIRQPADGGGANIGFLVRDSVLDGVSYRLRTRPVENMERCTARIGREIKKAGIKTVQCIEDRRRTGPASGYAETERRAIVLPL